MVSGCEEIIENSYGIDNVGLWTGIFVSVLGVCEMSVMRKFNSIIVPMIMVLLVALASKGDIDFAGEIGVEKILGYCGMNIMMGGYIIAEQEEEFKAKQILFISVVTAVFFAASIMLVYSVSIDYRNFSMPVFEFSKSCDMKRNDNISSNIQHANRLFQINLSGKCAKRYFGNIQRGDVDNIYFAFAQVRFFYVGGILLSDNWVRRGRIYRIYAWAAADI